MTGAVREVIIQGAVRTQRSSLVVRESLREEVSWYLQDEKECFRQRKE